MVDRTSKTSDDTDWIAYLETEPKSEPYLSIATALRKRDVEIERLRSQMELVPKSRRELLQMAWSMKRQRDHLARTSKDLQTQLLQHAETCKESAWPLGRPDEKNNGRAGGALENVSDASVRPQTPQAPGPTSIPPLETSGHCIDCLELETVLRSAVAIAAEARECHDRDQDARVMKILLALSGELPKYRSDTDRIHDVLRRRSLETSAPTVVRKPCSDKLRGEPLRCNLPDGHAGKHHNGVLYWTTETPCDGNHAEPACADPQCWQKP